MTGGEVILHGGAFFATKAHHTVNLNGGTLTVLGENFTANSSAGSSVLNWNGGVVKLGDAKQLKGFKTVNVGERNAILDTSLAGERCTLEVPLSGTGKLILRGAGYRTSVIMPSTTVNSGLTGIVVEDGGNAMINSAIPATCPILVKNGGTLSAYYSNNKPANLTLGETESDVTTLLNYEYTGYYPSGYVPVTGTLTINGKVYIGGREPTHGALVFTSLTAWYADQA